MDDIELVKYEYEKDKEDLLKTEKKKEDLLKTEKNKALHLIPDASSVNLSASSSHLPHFPLAA